MRFKKNKRTALFWATTQQVMVIIDVSGQAKVPLLKGQELALNVL
jgi:hypothetical protein